MLIIIQMYIFKLYIKKEFSLQDVTNSSSYLINLKHIIILYLKLRILLSNPIIYYIKLLINNIY